MIFEEALALMRKGIKVTHISYAKDEYLVSSYIRDKQKNKYLTLIKYKGNKQHSDMISPISITERLSIRLDISKKIPCYPHINLLLLMCDKWEIFNN